MVTLPVQVRFRRQTNHRQGIAGRLIPASSDTQGARASERPAFITDSAGRVRGRRGRRIGGRTTGRPGRHIGGRIGGRIRGRIGRRIGERMRGRRTGRIRGRTGGRTTGRIGRRIRERMTGRIPGRIRERRRGRTGKRIGGRIGRPLRGRQVAAPGAAKSEPNCKKTAGLDVSYYEGTMLPAASICHRLPISG